MIRVIRSSSLLQYGAALLASMLVLLFAVPGLRENLLSTAGNGAEFMRHDMCYHFVGPLVYTHFVSDLLIGLSYVSISATLAYLVNRARRDIPFHWVFVAFGLFIVACGSTHFMEAWTTFRSPVYWLAGYLKLITAVASVATAIVLPPLVPRTLALVRDAKLSDQRRLELEAANRELEGLYSRVKELDELKTQFFANVSHELRTPLSLILGPAGRLLSSEGLSGPQRESVETIERNARALLKHVNDLLDISKLEAGKMIVSYSETDLAELVRLTSAYFQSFASERGIDFKVDAPDALRAEADGEKLQRVIINLLSNAFKFTPDGGEVRCTLRGDADHAALEVSDSGPGVPADLREAIFERFRQGEVGAARRFGGTGLGLAITKEFVELHGGAITVSDAPEGGARFRVEVPLEAPAGAQSSAPFDTPEAMRESARQALGSVETEQRQIVAKGVARDDASRGGGAGAAEIQQPAGETSESADARPADSETADSESRVARLSLAPLVLVVEDNAEMNRFVAEVVGQRCRVESAFDGREGVERALRLRPDLIVCDVMMPGAGGEEFIRSLRRHEELRDVPVLMLSAKADDGLRVRLLREGAQDFLTKPFVAEELRARAENLVEIKVTRELLQRELESRSGDLTQLAGEVSQRRREMESALTALREANRKLEAIIEASPLAIVTLDGAGRVQSWSAAAERIFGWREVEVLGEPLPTVPEDRREEVARNHAEAVAGKIFSDHETRRRRRDGTLIDVAISTSPLKDADGSSHGVVALVADITARKRAEQAIAAQAAALREQASVIEQAYDAIILRDPSNAITLWNRGAERMYGFTQEEARGHSPHDLLKTEFPAPLAEIYARLRGEGYWEGELTHARKDGARIVVESRWATLRGDAGEVTSILEINRDVTERKRAEEALRVSETRFRSLVEQSPLSTQIFSPEGLTLEANRAWERLWGVTLDQFPEGYNILEDEQLAERGIMPHLRRAFAGEAAEIPEIAYVPDRGEFAGQERWVQARIYPVKDEAGAVREVVLVHEDVTERRRAEAALRESEERFAKAFAASPLALTITSLRDGRLVEVNETFTSMSGYTREESVGRTTTELALWVNPSDREAEVATVVRNGRVRDAEYRFRMKDGTERTGLLSAERIEIGGEACALTVIDDITEQKRAEAERKAAEAAVRENERRLQIVTDNAPVLIAYFDTGARYLFVNRPYAERIGLARERIVGRRLPEIVGREAYDALSRHVESALAGRREELEMELPYERIGRRFVHALLAPSFGEGGEVQGFVAVITDVTERRREEENQKFLSDATTVLASSLDYASTLDAVARMASRHLTDYCLVDLLEDDGTITRLVTAHRDPARAEEWREMQRRFPLDPAADYTIPRVLSTGEPMLYAEPTDELLEAALSDREQIETLKRFGIRSSMIVPLRARGRTLGAISFVSTDARRRYAERELRVAEELARRAALAVDNARLYERAQEANRAKDEFLATLSHELRTPLTPIIGWVHLLGGPGLGPEEMRHGLAVIDKNSQALARLINDLLDMSAILNGKMRIDRAPVLVAQVVSEAAETVRAQADRRGVRIEIAGCDDAGGARSLVSGDRTRLAQVFWNLLTNAVKFSEDGGKVRVSCWREAESFVVRVDDEGVGITPEFLPHVFDRFRQADMSTTKLYGGLGIGLALVRSFVEAHGGTVRAESEGPGRGSRFTVKLPAAASGAGGQGLGAGEEKGIRGATPHVAVDTKSGASQTIPVPRPPSPNPRRALVVEDAPDTLEMLRLFFAARGFEVTACADPAEALDVATRAHFDIIVTDIGLPNIDGYELLRRLRRESPRLAGVPALAVTGFAAETDVESARAAGFDAHVAKPFDPAALASAVDELLARRRGPADSGNGGE